MITLTDLYSNEIKLLNSLNNRHMIHSIEENVFEVRKEYISKWFSVQETSKEVLTSESIHIYENGEIIESETIRYYGNDNELSSHLKRKFIQKEKLVILTSNNKPTPWSSNRDSMTIDDYFGIDSHKYKNGEIVTYNTKDGGKRLYYYGAGNRILKKENFDSQNKLSLLVTYIYNVDEKIIRIDETEYPSCSTNSDYYDYDNRGNLINVSYWDSGVRKQDNYTYDDYNNLASINAYYQGAKKLKIYEYKYNEYKDWVERREIENGEYRELKIRQIKYK